MPREEHEEAVQVLRLLVVEEARRLARALPHDHDINLALRALDRAEQRANEEQAR